MAGSNISGPGGYGLILEEVTGWGFNRTGGTVSVGEVLQCDHTAASTDFTHSDQAFTTGDFTANFIVPVAGTATVPGVGTQVDKDNPGQPGAIFVCVIDTGPSQGADNGLIRVAYKHSNVMVQPVSGGALTQGLYAAPTASVKTVTNTLTKGKKCIAMARKTGATDTLTACIFNGVEGLGSAVQDDID